jgi:uncharacterized Zn-binding protein involved in type VI secretion
MPKASRKTDLCTGHPAAPPRPAVQGSPNCTINDLAALRETDLLAPHGNPPHPGNVQKGLPTVTINDLPAARVGDPVTCGGSMNTGSPNVIIG